MPRTNIARIIERQHPDLIIKTMAVAWILMGVAVIAEGPTRTAVVLISFVLQHAAVYGWMVLRRTRSVTPTPAGTNRRV